MRRISTPSLGLVLLAGVLVAGTAHADVKKNPLDGAPAVRHKLELRKLRFEVTPQLVVSMNQDFRHFIGGGLVLNFHITDWLGVGLQVAAGGGIDSGLGSAVNNQLISETSSDFGKIPFQPSREQYQAHVASINLVSSLYAQLTPFAGKLAIFGSGYARYDLSIMLGVGLMNLVNTWAAYTPKYAGATKGTETQCTTAAAMPDPNLCDPKNNGLKFSGMWGIGMHLFFNEWLALNLELRGFVTSTNMGGLDIDGNRALDGKDSTVTNNMFAGVGLTFLLPIHAKVSP